MKKYVCQSCGTILDKPKVYCKKCARKEALKWILATVVTIALPTIAIIISGARGETISTTLLFMMFMPSVIVAGYFPMKVGAAPSEVISDNIDE